MQKNIQKFKTKNLKPKNLKIARVDNILWIYYYIFIIYHLYIGAIMRFNLIFIIIFAFSSSIFSMKHTEIFKDGKRKLPSAINRCTEEDLEDIELFLGSYKKDIRAEEIEAFKIQAEKASAFFEKEAERVLKSKSYIDSINKTDLTYGIVILLVAGGAIYLAKDFWKTDHNIMPKLSFASYNLDDSAFIKLDTIHKNWNYNVPLLLEASQAFISRSKAILLFVSGGYLGFIGSKKVYDAFIYKSILEKKVENSNKIAVLLGAKPKSTTA